MRKRIDGRYYDTDTARMRGWWSECALYQKKQTGEFFVALEKGRRIIPLPPELAEHFRKTWEELEEDNRA